MMIMLKKLMPLLQLQFFILFFLSCGNQYLNEKEANQIIESETINDDGFATKAKNKVEYVWNKEGYRPDLPGYYQTGVSFRDSLGKIIKSYTIKNLNPYYNLNYPKKETEFSFTYDLSNSNKYHPVFEYADNVVISQGSVYNNNYYSVISYNVTLRNNEWPYKYKTSFIILNDKGEIIKKMDFDVSCHNFFLSDNGKYLSFMYEKFNEEVSDDYPSEAGYNIVEVGSNQILVNKLNESINEQSFGYILTAGNPYIVPYEIDVYDFNEEVIYSKTLNENGVKNFTQTGMEILNKRGVGAKLIDFIPYETGFKKNPLK